jgi:hypothetical protein
MIMPKTPSFPIRRSALATSAVRAAVALVLASAYAAGVPGDGKPYPKR